MSVKTKLSLMVSLIVFVLLVLNVILNEYSTRVNLRSDVESTILHTSNQIAASVAQYDKGNQLYDRALEDKLRAASIEAAEQLGSSAEDISNEELVLLAYRIGVSQLVLLKKEGNSYVVKRSTRKGEIGLNTQAWGSWDRVLKQGAGKAQSSAKAFWTGPTESIISETNYTEKWSFYIDENQDYIISCSLQDLQASTYTPIYNPGATIKQTMANKPAILEITGFDPAYIEENASKTVDRRAVRFGTYDFEEASADAAYIRRAIAGENIFHDAELLGRSVIKSFLYVDDPNPYVISVVMDKGPMSAVVQEQRINQIIICGGLLLIVILCSYWLSDILMRPVRSILWKVNEVSFGRFDNSIEVKRKDELGQLAQRVNAMSKNLGIYMAKLKLAFEENRSMKEYLESFINHTTDAIHVVDLEGRITQVNRAFEQLFGYEASEAIDNILPLIPEHLVEEEQEVMEWLKEGKLLSSRETTRMTKSGELIDVSITTSPIRDKHGAIRAIASITRDMTSRNKMEELLRRSEKLTTVGQLAAGVAHEIRNPLTTLRGFLQLQLETGKLNNRHINIMLSELDRINLIVGEFLILAKPQVTRFEEKDIRLVLNDVISLLDSQAHLCNIEFVTKYTEESCQISCEDNQLKQVFINVLKNAIEAMPEGGQISIVIGREANRSVMVSITDQGIGIPEDMISKLGDPFFTGKESGTGLGIMVSQRIIQSHQGTMDIDSRVNVGTVVTITLPLLTEKSLAQREVSASRDHANIVQ
ncbi:sensor histidine kinase [Paenibacillus mendelii]|uniref:histidine kinase n=1 Tax=Paenibacillus mendelii TaxID=206163 RepID=A0ABV6J4S5_9BACL|nr:sensor histidine kinase [Paenibacillus mendelii]MCQ6561691.1 PAS domain S-box protein [Paenibacillus mendelii]